MALLRKLFYRKPPDGLLEISDRVYVFDSCFGTDSLEEKNYKGYIEGVANQLREHFPDASLLVFNFRQSETETQMTKIMYENNMTIMDYPRHYEGCPILSMELIYHFLRSTESWLALGPQKILLMHCEHGGWPVLAFMLAALLIYSKQYTGELRTLDMVHKQAPRELLPMLSQLNPIPSQLRYLQYVSRRNVASHWPPLDMPLTLDCMMIRLMPDFTGEGGCRPLFRIYAQDPLSGDDRAPKLLFSTQTKTKAIRLYKQADSELVKIDINCNVQGDVVLECTSLRGEKGEDIMFRIMFNTAFIRSNILILNRDEIDTPWNTKYHFSRDFRAEILFSHMDASASVIAANLSCFEEKQGLPMEAFATVQEFFSHVDWLDCRADAALGVIQKISASRSLCESLDCAARTEILQRSSPQKVKEKLNSDISGNSEALHNHGMLSPKLSKNSNLEEREEPNKYLDENQPESITQKLAEPSRMSMLSASSSVARPRGEKEYDTKASQVMTSSSLSDSPENSSAPDFTSKLLHIHSLAAPDDALNFLASRNPLALTSVKGESGSSAFEDVRTRAGARPAVASPSMALLNQGASPRTSTPSLPSHAKCPSAFSSEESNPDNLPSSSPAVISSSPTSGAAQLMPPVKPNISEISVLGCGQKQSPSTVMPKTSTLISNSSSNLSTVRTPPLAPPLLHPHIDNIRRFEPRSPPTPPPAPLSSLKVSYENGGSRPAPPPPPSPQQLGSTPPPPPSLPPGSVPKQKTSFPIPSAPPPPVGCGNGASKTGTAAPKTALPSSSLNVRGRNLSRGLGPKDSQNKKLKPLHWLKLTRAVQGSLWAESQKSGEFSNAPEIDMSELENLFSASVPNSGRGASGGKLRLGVAGSKSDKVQLVDHRRACNCEIMLSKVKIPLQELMASVLSLEVSALDADQVENLIKFCPTKEEMELLKGYRGEHDKLGKCEQFFLELMGVPRVEAKLRVFSFKMQFETQVSDLRKSLSTVSSASDQIRNSVKLKRVMQTILSLGNALNQGTARGSAVGFRLDSLLKLTETRARNNKMTLMHYLCKVIDEKLPEVLDFSEDLTSLEPASKIQLKYLAEEMQAINKGLEKVVQELSMSEDDGPVSEEFHKTLKEFLCFAEAEVRSLALLYSSVGRNVDALIVYFGEDPSRCPFEQVVTTLLNFTVMFNRAHEENHKQLENERKKAEKDLEYQRLATRRNPTT
ncbi:hypothetical protein RND81_08G082800 [Saponaria officinalis]|uniref:Formin-like protein n=1 Tax=Saponaria officinalis TaxID=3572 RepID=A0AAW1J6J4_SAPOF